MFSTSSNRLARESSPYLLLHAHNPVDWYPWGEEALERARAEDRPIFLSVGYSTCYWCHVMERESFSQPAVAAVMNSELVNIKVDREERPDLDEIYMAATQFLSEHGGWPNSVFLTPELKPFFAGTYFPPDDRHGRPGFPSLVEAIAEAWRSRRDEIEEQAEEVTRAIRRFLEERVGKGTQLPSADVGRRSLASLERRFDPLAGGFGGAPKFPTPSNLFLLLDRAAGYPRAGEMLAQTLDRMARGGIYDQLAGGFHRYATDREWKVPHFEKMLYDNGFLLELYAREFQRTGDPESARIARETAAFLERELSGPDGEFWSALDAETDGREGAYYVWTRAELLAALGADDAVFLRSLLGFDGPPFFEQDRYVLHLPLPLPEQAAARRMTLEQLLAEMAPGRARLLDARDRRPRIATDDKVLADWNGMAIAGFAVAGKALNEPALIERAARAADFALERLRVDGALQHVWRGGQARIPAFLADFAFLIRGLLRLSEADSDPRWLEAAVTLQAEQEERLGDPAGGYFSAGASPDLLFRTKEVFDGAVPAANAIAVLNLLDLHERTGEARYRERAEAALRIFAPTIEAQVEGARMMAIAVRRVRGEATTDEGAVPLPPLASALEAEARRVVRPTLEVDPGAPGVWRRFRLRAVVEKGWHVHANPAEEGFVATTLEAEGAELRALEYPPASETARALELAIYAGEFEIAGELRADAPRPALRLSYQACDDRRCLPAVMVTLPV